MFQAARGLALVGFGLAFGLGCGQAFGDALVGDVAAAYSTPEAAQDNPANAAFLEQTQFFYAGEILKNETINVRYPGFEPTTLTNSGISTPLNKPSFIVKATPRLGIGGFIIPPLPTTINIKKSKIPVVIVGTQTYVDLNVEAKENGIGVATIGYRLSDRLGIGIGADFQAISLTATLVPSGSTNTLATIDGSISQADIIVGVRYDVLPGRLLVGAAVTVASQQTQTLNVSSPLTGGGSASGPATSGGSQAQGIRPFTGALVGAQISPIGHLHLMGEVRYTHVDTTQQGYSLVNLKQENQDLHDTVALRAGMMLGVLSWVNLLGGFRYEPASLGQGTSGANGEIGFGTINLVQVLAGLSPMTPYYMVAGGLQLGFLAKYPPHTHSHKGDEPQHPYYQLALEGGVAYTYASVGIDSTGELPGAYLYRKISVPVALSYKF